MSSFPNHFYETIQTFSSTFLIAGDVLSQEKTFNNYDAFLKKNRGIKSIYQQYYGCAVIVELKSGHKETYNIYSTKQKANFTRKYGVLPFVVPMIIHPLLEKPRPVPAPSRPLLLEHKNRIKIVRE